MSFCAIDDKTEKQLMVIWDLGRRCTFSCSYCPPHRKNNWSATASFEELKATADNLERYSKIYDSKRNEPFRVACSFTGGEPTVNPAFFKFLIYLKETYPHWKRTLTTNGFYTKRKLETVMASTEFTTVSYHCEGTHAQKKQVRENLQTMIDAGYNFKINIMFHERADYFQECVNLSKWCDAKGVTYVPRVIGDQGDIKQGLKDKTVHTYTDAQMKWLNLYWEAKKNGSTQPATDATTFHNISPPSGVMFMASVPTKTVGQTIGRPCCGGRDMETLNDTGDWEATKFLKSNNFQGWSCMVNWYFLYIHQEVDQIWHHQTCQVNLNGDVGPICKASEFDKYCDDLETTMNMGILPFIRCPKTHCGCGLCTPKAKDDELAERLFKSHAPGIEPRFMEQKEIKSTAGSLKATVYKFDEDNGNETI